MAPYKILPAVLTATPETLPATRREAIALGAKYYFTGRPCPRGHIAPRRVSKAECWECLKYYWRTYQSQKSASAPMRHGYYWRRRASSLPLILLSHAKQRAKRKGFAFSITAADISPIPECCPCCGRKFEIGDQKRHKASPSIDRLRNEDGYVPGNVALLCWECNNTKGTADAQYLRKIAEWIELTLINLAS
jgi:hypothetical protein